MMLTAIALSAMINIYPATMTVTSVSNNVVTMETSTGYIYEMEGAEDWMPGDLAALIMSDNGTPDNVTDDEIVSARYAGYWTENGSIYRYEE